MMETVKTDYCVGGLHGKGVKDSASDTRQFLKKSNRYNLICVVFLHLLLKGFRRKKNSFFSEGNEVLVAVCIP